MRLTVTALVLTALVAAGMVRLAHRDQQPVRTPLPCFVDALDAQGRPVHKLCANGRGYERTTGRWRDVGPMTPLLGVPAR